MVELLIKYLTFVLESVVSWYVNVLYLEDNGRGV